MTEDDTFQYLLKYPFEKLFPHVYYRESDDIEHVLRKYGWTIDEYRIAYFSTSYEEKDRLKSLPYPNKKVYVSE